MQTLFEKLPPLDLLVDMEPEELGSKIIVPLRALAAEQGSGLVHGANTLSGLRSLRNADGTPAIAAGNLGRCGDSNEVSDIAEICDHMWGRTLYSGAEA